MSGVITPGLEESPSGPKQPEISSLNVDIGGKGGESATTGPPPPPIRAGMTADHCVGCKGLKGPACLSGFVPEVEMS